MTRVSVIMPVYNGEKYLEAAINSILSQTFSDFEFLILNDGSTDGSRRIIESFSDSRIKVVHHTKNLGLVETLNRAFDMASGEYIIRMDCDDIAMPTRIEKQVHFLDLNPAIGVVGTFCRTIGTETKDLRFPVQHENIRLHALFDCPIAHPTVALRRSILPTPAFDPRFIHAEDYELWTRLLDQGVQFYTIPEFLLFYRFHEQQVSTSARTTQLAVADTIRARWLLQLGITLTDSEMPMHRMVAHSAYIGMTFDPLPVCDHLERLLLANENHCIFEHRLFFRELAMRHLYAFSRAHTLSGKQFRRFIQSRLWRPVFLLKKSFCRACLARMRSLMLKGDA